MNKVKVCEATNTQLDWLVAKCESFSNHLGTPHIRKSPYGDVMGIACRVNQAFVWYKPTTDWSLMGPIIEREKIILQPPPRGERYASSPWSAGWDYNYDWMMDGEQSGPTPLIAAARCYVASKLGEEVEVPEELV